MTLTELQQVKRDVESGVMVSKATWLRVLETAIKAQPAMTDFQKMTNAIRLNNAMNPSMEAAQVERPVHYQQVHSLDWFYRIFGGIRSK